MAVHIRRNPDGTIDLSSPYHPRFPAKATGLGGKWNPQTEHWTFDARDEAAVRALCIQTYGSDGEATDLVEVVATARQDIVARRTGIFLAGRCVARARDRDSGARPGEGVVRVDGPGPRSGGSRQYWETVVPAGCVVRLRDVPTVAAEAGVADAGSGWEVVICDT